MLERDKYETNGRRWKTHFGAMGEVSLKTMHAGMHGLRAARCAVIVGCAVFLTVPFTAASFSAAFSSALPWWMRGAFRVEDLDTFRTTFPLSSTISSVGWVPTEGTAPTSCAGVKNALEAVSAVASGLTLPLLPPRGTGRL